MKKFEIKKHVMTAIGYMIPLVVSVVLSAVVYV